MEGEADEVEVPELEAPEVDIETVRRCGRGVRGDDDGARAVSTAAGPRRRFLVDFDSTSSSG